ncbi:MAG: hypothetical protein COB08_013710 [Rhodobacteraceae bacterium]|nr:hypothetical protein [Paracoccaceae bacterium]
MRSRSDAARLAAVYFGTLHARRAKTLSLLAKGAAVAMRRGRYAAK